MPAHGGERKSLKSTSSTPRGVYIGPGAPAASAELREAQPRFKRVA